MPFLKNLSLNQSLSDQTEWQQFKSTPIHEDEVVSVSLALKKAMVDAIHIGDTEGLDNALILVEFGTHLPHFTFLTPLECILREFFFLHSNLIQMLKQHAYEKADNM